MSRPLRIEFSGALYHVMARGNAREAPSRDAAIETTYASGAYTLKAIGEHFGLHYATISRIARRMMLQNKT